MIFLTVGTQFGFDRLVKAVDEAVDKGHIEETVYAQIGQGNYIPRYMEHTENLEKEAFDKVFESCRAVISHAGMGSISLAIGRGKPLLVMPRLRKYDEVVNDHQVDTARKFEELGHILAAYDEAELAEKIRLLETFVPKPRIPNRQGVIDRIQRFLKDTSNRESIDRQDGGFCR